MVTLQDVIRAYNLPTTTLPLAEIPQGLDISIPTTQNTAALALGNPVFRYQPATKYGFLLGAFAVNADATTAANYLFRLSIRTGTTELIIGNDNGVSSFEHLPSTNSYNPIPEGIYEWMPKGTICSLFAYYNGTSGQDGSVSVSLISELL